MNIKDYVKKFNLSFDNLKSEHEEDFNSLYEEEKEWLGNLENKVHLLKNEKDPPASPSRIVINQDASSSILLGLYVTAVMGTCIRYELKACTSASSGSADKRLLLSQKGIVLS